MRPRLFGLASFALALIPSGAALAQVTGEVFGRVVEKEGGAPLSGVTVIATGPQGDQGAVTDDDGRYELRGLPLGAYVVRFYYGDVTVEQPAVQVSVDKRVRVDGQVPPVAPETVRVVDRAPVVDVGSTRVGVTVDEDYTRNVPNTVDVGGVLAKAPGAFLDPVHPETAPGAGNLGLSIAGTTGGENFYLLDGVNVTNVGYGVLGTNLFTPFIQEVEIITGGIDAEYGRALGGIVNIATRSGGNEFHGSAFSYVTPGLLTGNARRARSWATSLTGYEDLGYDLHLGAEAGGPIVKNKLFFWVGYAPQLGRSDTVRIASRFVDADGDGQPDGAGSPTTEELFRSEHGGSVTQHQYVGKLTYRPAPEHSLSLGVYGVHGSNEYLRWVNADPRAAMTLDQIRRNDVSLRWLSRLFERRWQIEANLGMHAEGTAADSPFADMRQKNSILWLSTPSLAQFDVERAGAACTEDPVTHFSNCPVARYRSGGYGVAFDRDALRLSARLKSTHLFRAAGWHELKWGGEYEWNGYDSERAFTGPDGQRGFVFAFPGFDAVQTLYRLPPGRRVYMYADHDDMAMNPNDPDGNGDPADLLKPPLYQDRIRAETETRNVSAFLQESWSPLPNLTLRAGLRWESQQLVDYQGNTAISIDDSWAPRVGAIYDPTNSGRAKVYGNFGRYFQSIPLGLNDRAFGGEGVLVAAYAGCEGPKDQWGKCAPIAYFPSAGENLLVQKNIGGAYSDEVVLGAQYEVLDNLVLGAAYIKRWIGRVVEDAAGVVANPGDIPKSVVDEYEAKAAAAEAMAGPGASADQRAAAAEARFLADAARTAAEFPKPKRDYDAVQLTATRRFSENWLLQASYTYSRTRGNYPGLYSADTGQSDPNYISLYDLADLLMNREGPLPNDRPHNLRIDGYYTFTFGRSALTTGLGWVVRSGRPQSVLGSHPAYGPSEVFLLPRGADGRTPTVWRLDLHLGYRTRLTNGTSLEAFVDVFNVFNQRIALAQDQDYTLDAVEPIIGGTKSDLVHLKNTDGEPARRNPNYGRGTVYAPPISGRLGLRLAF